MRYKIMKHTRRNRTEFYTIMRYWWGIPIGNVEVSPLVHQAQYFLSEETAQEWIDNQCERKRQDKQRKHDQEIIKSEVVAEREC